MKQHAQTNTEMEQLGKTGLSSSRVNAGKNLERVVVVLRLLSRLEARFSWMPKMQQRVLA